MEQGHSLDMDLEFINSLEVAKHPSFYFMDILQKANLTSVIDNVSAVSRELGISRKGFYDFIHGSTGISPIMSVRLAALFKKYLPDNKSACDYNYWWNLHSAWYFQNEIRKLCTKAEPLYRASQNAFSFAADSEEKFQN